MDVEVTHRYQLCIDDNDDDFTESGIESNVTKVTDIRECVRCSYRISIVQFMSISFQLSLICGILFGLFPALLWWIELNVRGYCAKNYNSIPKETRRLRLMVVGSCEAVVLMMWPLLNIFPYVHGSWLKKLMFFSGVQLPA